ncbi:hypothetical protein RRG08_034334 [Elysia crispata]|uniref:Secreted protein n=1 Tax=Elysia crispata TaxID=231223 RepID=A0AAE1E8T8_9GAST|nr:hypothetical protein RRG08_034334 [Elysia crispata]
MLSGTKMQRFPVFLVLVTLASFDSPIFNNLNTWLCLCLTTQLKLFGQPGCVETSKNDLGRCTEAESPAEIPRKRGWLPQAITRFDLKKLDTLDVYINL